MIVDHIVNRERYYDLGEGYRLALDFFASYDSSGAKKGDISLDGENVFIKVRPMLTKPKECGKFEAHNKYTDIHFVAGGTESIGYALRSKLVETEYNGEKDVANLEGEGCFITLERGFFMITQPQDAHMPALASDGKPAELIKLIAKVKI